MFLCNDEAVAGGNALTKIEDLGSLMHLHEPDVLQTLQYRFDVDEIYTFCGPILIAVNPFKGIPNIYSAETCKGIASGASRAIPHIFTVANRTSSALTRERDSQ